jgi:AraC-like DNA-binding protein
MMLDPLSDLVELADAQCGLSGAVLGSGEWAAELQSPGSLKFFVMRQTCWFTIEHESALRVDPGDVILIRVGRSYCMESQPGVALGGKIAFVKDEFIAFDTYASDECVAMACFVALDDTRGHLLLDLLPACIVVRGSEPEAMGLRLLYEQLVREVRSINAGAKLAVSKLTQLIFLQVLRAHLSVVQDGLPISSQGWLTALGDNKIAHALQAMHQQPARGWTLDELARTVSMSRTSFAKRFRMTMGGTPLNYLRDLRMAIAAKNLCDSNQTVSTIAFDLGYGSEAAFSSAFKKSMKLAPKFYRENAMRRKA